MIARSKYILVPLLILISIVIGFLLGPVIPFSIQKTLATTLGGISSILFGVLGIWIGIMAPENLKSIYMSKEDKTKRDNWKALENLYRPVFISLFIFAISTSFSFIGELVKTISFLLQFVIAFRITGMIVMMLMMFSTIYLILISIRPGVEMLAKSMTFLTVSERMESRYPQKKKRKESSATK